MTKFTLRSVSLAPLAWSAVACIAASSVARARQCDGSCETLLVSANTSGAISNGSSYYPFVSANGRFVVFWSTSTDLVANDTNDMFDVFVRDLQNGTTSIASLAFNGAPANGHSISGPMTPDGRYVLFSSKADNLVLGDTNFHYDVFLRDRVNATTTRESVGSAGEQGNSDSFARGISTDGRWVLFDSWAGTLVPGDTNIKFDVFVRDRTTGVTTRESVSSTGIEGNDDSTASGISDDGRFVLFSSKAFTLVPGDTNVYSDVFLRDRSTSTTVRISVGPGGVQATAPSYSGALSSDGNWAVFTSNAPNLVPGDVNGKADVFRYERATGSLELISVGTTGMQVDGGVLDDGISLDGRFAYIESFATNLVAGDVNGFQDVFALGDGQVQLVSLSSAGVQGNADSYNVAANADGTTIVFESNASNLVSGDTNGFRDVFVRRCSCSTPNVYCIAKPNSLGCASSLSFSGSPSASAGSGFTIDAASVINNKLGLLFYGKTAATFLPFQGGYLCAQPPLVRTNVQSTAGGPPPNDCTGSMTIDFNVWIASGQDPALVAGRAVWAQYWSRDPGVQPSVAFTPALAFTIGL
jgi:hypothetical protein